MEKRFIRNDRSTVWVELTVSFHRDAAGRPVYCIAIFQDISERKRLEGALRESEARFRTLAEALPTMVWTAEPDGTIDYINSRLIEYTGLTLEQLRDRDRGSTLHPEDRPRCIEQWMRSVATGEPYEVEYRHCRADGAFRWHLGQALPLRDESGRITKWFGSITDIDDQKRAAEALREAKEAAEAASRAKDEFLANVSHEIRTPMNAILGMTELTLDTPLTDDQRQCLSTVKSAADNLLGMINDLLDFSKIEAGKLELEPADFSLRAALGDTLRTLAMRAHRKGLELACHVQPDVPDALVGDAGRLRQVWLNLIGNAIKFTERGEVLVLVELVSGGRPLPATPSADGPRSPEVELRFAVTDTGIGIPPEKQAKIFRAFEQEDTTTKRKYGGFGLGLSIAARLVALMGGTIAVQSEPGRGSTFDFTAKFGRQPHPTETTPALPPVLLRDLRVLIVDDNATNRHILEEWLRDWRMNPTAVGDGVAAMDVLWDAASGRADRTHLCCSTPASRPSPTAWPWPPGSASERALSAIRAIILLTSGDRPGDVARSRRGADRRPPAQARAAGRIARGDLPSHERGQGRRTAAGRAAAGPWRTRSWKRPRPSRRCASWWRRTQRVQVRDVPGAAPHTAGSQSVQLCEQRAASCRPWWKKRASTCCSWTCTCRSWTASRWFRSCGGGSGPRGDTSPSSP